MFVLSRRQQYPPLTLRRLQYLIDLGRVDPSRPIDLTQLVNGRGVTIQPLKHDYGVNLVEEVWAFMIIMMCSLMSKVKSWVGDTHTPLKTAWPGDEFMSHSKINNFPVFFQVVVLGSPPIMIVFHCDINSSSGWNESGCPEGGSSQSFLRVLY